MKKILQLKERKKLIIAAVSLLYWLGSFAWEHNVFATVAGKERVFTYILVKLLALLAIYALLRFFVSAVSGLRAKNEASQVLLYALPPFLLIAGFWLYFDYWATLYGDQLVIINAAYEYSDLGGFFHYLTIYIPMISMTIIPSGEYAVVLKIFYICLGLGYCIYRLRRIRNSALPFLLYFPFLIPPGFYLSYNIHRCPMYAVLYMLVSCILLCDHIEGRELSRKKFIVLSLLLAVLTQWRYEGIYLIVFAPILLYLCYRPQLNSKRKSLALAAMLLAQLIVYLPQTMKSRDEPELGGGRTMPLFEYLITGMMRNGIDTEENAVELAQIDKYIPLEEIRKINLQGDYNYLDNVISVDMHRHGASEEVLDGFKSAVIRLIIKHPEVYIKNQLKAWASISSFHAAERKLDVIANVFTDLYVPSIWLLLLFTWTLLKKKWLPFILTACHLCHMLITTAVLPAAYFKYYYSEYLYAVLSFVLVLQLVSIKYAHVLKPRKQLWQK